MKTGWLLQTCIVLAVGMGLIACTKEQINQAMTVPTQILTFPTSSGSGNTNSPQPASPNANGSSGQRTSTVVTPAGEVSTSDSVAASVWNGSVGPDVIGLRIGTMPADARAILKSRVLISDGMRKGYKETSRTLTWKVPGRGINVPVPNGQSIESFVVNGGHDDQSPHDFTVWFSAVPGQERLLALRRSDTLYGDKRPTLGSFEKTLFEKYGTPVYRQEPTTGTTSIWSYNSNGKLQSLGSEKDVAYCLQIIVGGMQNVLSSWNWNDQEFEQASDRCGAAILIVSMAFDSKYVGQDTLIRNYQVRMEGFAAALHAGKVARGIIDKEQVIANEALIKKGQQQKPEF